VGEEALVVGDVGGEVWVGRGEEHGGGGPWGAGNDSI
jgi:hypothetical protein